MSDDSGFFLKIFDFVFTTLCFVIHCEWDSHIHFVLYSAGYIKWFQNYVTINITQIETEFFLVAHFVFSIYSTTADSQYGVQKPHDRILDSFSL